MNPEQIKKFRGSLGLTQQEFALLVGVKTRATIYSWEKGRKPIRARNMIKLMNLFDKKWIFLTLEEIIYIQKQFYSTLTINDQNFARAIEAKLKEKNI
jgi:transcriptional regulator with XRE-family HTH domain